MDPADELLPIVDDYGKSIGTITRKDAHDRATRPRHPVVHLHIFDTNGRLLLQKRSAHKRIQPGKWDTAVGGHICSDETVTQALVRETKEETGIDINHQNVHLLTSYTFDCEAEREFVWCHIVTISTAQIPSIQEDDIADLKYFTHNEILRLISQGLTTPNFAKEYIDLIMTNPAHNEM